jgi:predicted ATPase
LIETRQPGFPDFGLHVQEIRIKSLERLEKRTSHVLPGSFKIGQYGGELSGAIMLIEFRVGNFRSFDEPQTFSFVASSDARHPDNCISFGNLRLLKSAVVYGANASGKSNLIKALERMWGFVQFSATKMNVGDLVPVDPFQLNPVSHDKASFFEVAFVVGEVRYQYGFTATRKRVQDEWLIVYPKGRPRHLLERRFDLETGQTTWAFRGDLEKEGSLLRERTRDNGLVLSRGAELNITPLTTVYLWFRQQISVFDLSGPPTSLITHTAMRLKDDRAFRERVVRMIRDAGVGISDLEVSEEQPRVFFSEPMSMPISGVNYTVSVENLSTLPEMSGGAIVGSTSVPLASGTVSLPVRNVSTYFPPVLTIRSIHRSRGGDPVRFDFLAAESNGTQRFFALAGLWLDALDHGGLLVIDELDCSMHPTLTRKLVELFQARDVNRKGAQLVFSTHDSTLMDPELFRRDQVWIVEKDSGGASRLSSLYDFEERPRNNEALERRYLAGRFGGVPVFGPTFEDLKLE